MAKPLLLNMTMNLALGAILVALNSWALRNGLEETSVSLALLFGLVTMAANACFIAVIARRNH